MALAGRAAELAASLRLAPHPEGGHYRRVYAAQAEPGRRPALSAIHFLLAASEYSAWHRVDAEEAWHWVEGEPLELLVYRPEAGVLGRHRLGPWAAGDGASPLWVVPAGAWQAARPLGAYALCSCVVAPAFEFSGFRLLGAGDGALAARLAALVPEIPVSV